MYKGYHLQRVDAGYSWTWTKTLLFDIGTDLDEISLLKGKLKLSAGKAGSFDFSIDQSNTQYDKLQSFLSYIDIYRDDELIFSGRVVRPTINFDTTKSFEVEGNLAILNDTILRPIEFRSSDSQFMTVELLVEKLLENHNSQVSEEKQIFKGRMEVSPDTFIYRKYEDYKNTYERFEDLVDSYGGYLNVYRNTEDNKLYLDWIKEATKTAKQSIDFGENVLDITIEQNIDDVYSVIIPLGAEVEDEVTGERNRITIDSVSPDGLDYIQNDRGMNNYGRIVKVVTWDDVEDPLTLYSKADELLTKSVGLHYSISVNAVDLANAKSASYMTKELEDLLVDNDPYYIYGTEVIEHFKILEKVKVHSKPHGLQDDQENTNVFDILELELDLLNPESDNFTLGKDTGSYISNNVSRANEQANIIENISKNYAVNTEIITKLDRQYSSLIEQTSQQITSRVTEILTETGLIDRIKKVESQVSQTAEKLQFYFVWKDETTGAQIGEGYIDKYFTFDVNGFTIFNSTDTVYLEESNDHWAIKNGSLELLRGDIKGLIAQAVSVKSQLVFTEKIGENEISQWAFRKGNYISIKGGVNLNDVWVGG